MVTAYTELETYHVADFNQTSEPAKSARVGVSQTQKKKNQGSLVILKALFIPRG